ncbi:MAG: Hint domain-containing protein [Pseudomonadota bacterium]
MDFPTPTVSTLPSTTAPEPQQRGFGVRLADIAALTDDGRTIVGQRRIPTLSAFNAAFAAFAQGTLFQAKDGLIAVEDLHPGDWIATADGSHEQVSWIGSAVFTPRDQGEPLQLTRAMPDSFGVSRPESYISFGSAARVLQTPPDLRATTGAKAIMTPVSRFTDGINVIDVTPPTPLRLFHVATRRHTALKAGGLEVESYHPGHSATEGLSNTLTTVFMSLFPHVQRLSDLGPLAYARAPEGPNARFV